jgi:hypothetical protein
MSCERASAVEQRCAMYVRASSRNAAAIETLARARSASDRLARMLRAAGVAAVIAMITAGTAVSTVGEARADSIDDRIAELSSGENYKLRMASALSLSKSSDGRALRALAVMLLDSGSERSLRRVAVLGLSKQLPNAPASLRAELVRALERAASSDGDAKIRASAASAAKAVKKVMAEEPGGQKPERAGTPDRVGTGDGRDRPTPQVQTPGTLRSDAPKVFVNVDSAVDMSTKMSSAGLTRLTAQVKKSVSKMGYATAWPGSLPTAGDLRVNQARAYVVAATVKKVEVKKQSDRMTEVACTVTIRVAPWLGTDGNELWEADRAASASGSAKAQTGVSEREVAGGMRDCVEAVAEEIATRQVIPFLQRLVGT